MPWALDHNPIPELKEARPSEVKVVSQGCATEVRSELDWVPSLCCTAMVGNRMLVFVALSFFLFLSLSLSVCLSLFFLSFFLSSSCLFFITLELNLGFHTRQTSTLPLSYSTALCLLVILRQALTKLTRLILNVQFFCLGVCTAGMAGLYCEPGHGHYFICILCHHKSAWQRHE